MNSNTQLTVYAPIDHLPAEGFEASPAPDSLMEREALLQFYREALDDCGLIFELSGESREPFSVPATFGKFSLQFLSSEGSPVPNLVPVDDAELADFRLEIASGEVSDAAEPEDLVRSFLEQIQPGLDALAPASPHSKRTPLVRWQSDEETDRVQVQLLGVLELPEAEFEEFLSTHSDLTPVFEEAEVEAHGLKETAAALAVIGLTIFATPQAEAGPFKKLFSKDRAEVVQNTPAKTAPKTTQARQGWVDVHKDAKIDKKLIESHTGSPTRIVVDVSRQRAFILIDGQIAIDTAVSTARTGKYTPRGSFTITERIRSGKHSTIYGCEMPYWMRLGESPIGLHIGDLPGYPASAGCVRLPYSVAPVIFDTVGSGTQVKIVDSWDLVTNLWGEGGGDSMLMASISPGNN
ncbi:MAG: L,D-transpeptidase [Verrucomicrobiae bacterium]|nr:L,D-transpeptidase [Verrucomicrobiae bacterium]